MATQDEADVQAFDAALQSHGREQGGEIMSYGRQLLEEGKRLGEQHTKVEMVEGFLRAGVTWEVIEAATGLNESRFREIKENLPTSGK